MNQKLNLAMVRVSHEYPFHAGIINQWTIVCDPLIATMAVGIKDAKLVLCFSPDFVEKILLAELEGVILHEINHIIFGHLKFNTAKFPDSKALTTAMEITVNEYINKPLPGEPILLENFPGLPPFEDTVGRYKRLEKQVKKSMPIDDHSLWQEAKSHLGQIIINSALILAKDSLSAEAIRLLPCWLKHKIDKINGKSQENGMGNDITNICASEGKLSWDKILRRYIGNILENKPSLLWPPRRFPDLVGVYPGWRRSSAKPKVMAVIDTSGSMSEKELSQINGELEKMARKHTVIVVECDRKIQAVYQYKPILQVKGRGGTSFVPPFESKFLATISPDVVIYFTDGHGKAPKQPYVPVIWCICGNGLKPAEWGKEVVLAIE